jgi:hypothetical protein
VTTTNEQRVWDDLVRLHAVEAGRSVPDARRPGRGRGERPEGLEELAVGGVFAGIVLVLVGAVGAGLTVVLVAVLGWLLLRRRSRSRGRSEANALPVTGDVGAHVRWRGRHPRSLGP